MNEIDILERPNSSSSWMANYLPTIIWQRRYYALGCLFVAVLIGVTLAFALPTTYRSTATLLVQSQDLPTTVVDSPETGAVEQRIARIREQVLSRGDLIQLIEQNDLYTDQRRSQPLSKIIETMRHDTSVPALSSDIGHQSG